MMRLFWVIALILFHQFVALAQAPTEIPDPEVAAHRLDAKRPLPIKLPLDHPWPPYVRLELVVATDGTVASAASREGDPRYYDSAARAALDWTYKPFMRDGKPVSATFSEYVKIVPPERRPPAHTQFPEIKDWNSLRMSLERTGCFGTCPYYSLEIHGDGNVRYVGRQYVRFCGEWKGEIPLDSVRQLLEQFRVADFHVSLCQVERALPRARSGERARPSF